MHNLGFGSLQNMLLLLLGLQMRLSMLPTRILGPKSLPKCACCLDWFSVLLGMLLV